MSKGLRPVAAGAVSLVVLLAGPGFITHGSAAPIPGRLVAYDLHTGAVRFDVPTATPSASIHAVGPGVVVVTGAASCRRLEAQSPLMAGYSSSRGTQLWQRPASAFTACASHPPAVATHGVIALGDINGLEGVGARDGAVR
jgi:hypothetical protein